MSGARMKNGPTFDPATGLVTGEIELPGGLPSEEPEDLSAVVDGPVTPELLTEARGWVSDCSWKESEEYGIDPGEDFTDEEIVRGVDAHYDGGWASFVQASGSGPAETGRAPLPELERELADASDAAEVQA